MFHVLKKDITWATLDQALISGANLLFGLFFIHLSTKASYGLYSAGYSTILLFIGFGNALIFTQMTVLAPTKKDKATYFSEMLSATVIVALLFCISSIFIFSTVAMVVSPSTQIYFYAVEIGITIMASLLLEYFRQTNYIQFKAKHAFIISMFYVSIQLMLLSIIGGLFPQQGHIAAIAATGVAAIVMSIILYLQSVYRISINISDTFVSLRELSLHGKWALLGVLVTWLQAQSYIYITLTFAGTAEVADANAARLFVAPIMVVVVGITKVFLPRMADAFARNSGIEIKILARNLLIVQSCIVVVYASMVLAAKKFIFSTVLSSEYQQIDNLLLLWLLIIFFQIVRNSYSITLQVYREFRLITMLNLVSAMVVILLSIFLSSMFGAEGALLSIVAGEIVFSVLLWWGYMNVKR